jgi:lysophospholipase L1-like esterase
MVANRAATLSGTADEARPFPALQLLILCASIVVFLAILGEIALRLGELRTSNAADLQCSGAASLLHSQKGLFQLDAESGFSMRPNVCVHLQSNEYDQVLRTNSRGFVGPEIPAVKAAGEFRIVVLGDSYTAGGQVPHSHNYTALLEDRLHASGYTNVRVINAGIGGCGTFCQAGVLRENIGWMQPDLVVVSVFVGNNIVENVLTVHGGYRDAPEHPKGVTWGPAAGELLDQSGTWFPRNGLPPAADLPRPWDPTQPLPTPVGNAPPGTPPYLPPQTSTTSTSIWASARLAAHAVWDGLRTRSLLLGRFFGKPIDPSVTTAPGSLPPSVQLKRLNVSSFEWTILRDPPRTYWLDVAWPLFGSYIAHIRATAASAGAPTVLMVIPQMGQFDDQMRARAMADFRFREDEVDWDRPQREVQNQAAAAGTPVLDLLPAFRARADRAQLYLREDTHFAALGHQAAADQLAQFLQSGGWLPRRSP